MKKMNENLLIIAKNSIKKSKGANIVLFFLLIFSTVLMYSGISVLSQMNGFLEDKAKELNTSDYMCSVAKDDKAALEEILRKQQGTSLVEGRDIIESMTAEIQNGTKQGDVNTAGIYICPYKEDQVLSKPKFVGKHEMLSDHSIYVPYNMQIIDGYKVGDTLKVSITGIPFEFTVAGFFEDVVFANRGSSGSYEFYVSDPCLEKLRSMLDESKQRFWAQVKVKSGADIKAYQREVEKEFGEKAGIDASFEEILVQTYEQGNKVFISIMMAIIMAFAVVLMVISLVIIQFSINVEIERDMQNIGSLQAIGYTTKQIRRAILLQFFMIGISGILVGIVLAVLAAGGIGNIVSISVGLKWINKTSGLSIIASTVIILGLILAVALLAARRIHKITPLMALRSGIKTHNFKKNYFPLEQGRGNLNIQVGIKGIYQPYWN